ncbi:hypothetical protein [Treponema denticola]|uniref:hypothetical protein n=1 Tax=Treponema denticola TaxID=158 RepID=UPI0002B53E41|nr:hypothetical protein [Treponema denticola]EMB47018.1 hypothetical protein HMPREF9730_00036 [Treponema denticola AL-2]
MAIVNSEGQSISYDSSKLIKKLKKIVEVEGKEGSVLVSQKKLNGVKIIDNVYSLNSPEAEDLDLYQVKARECYRLLKKQHSIF